MKIPPAKDLGLAFGEDGYTLHYFTAYRFEKDNTVLIITLLNGNERIITDRRVKQRGQSVLLKACDTIYRYPKEII